MEFEHEKNHVFAKEAEDFAKHVGSYIKSDCYPVDQRLFHVTEWLKEAGVPPEIIMREYFNATIRVATLTRGVTGAYFLACQLYWHLVKIIKKLQETSNLLQLEELPPDPTKPAAPNA